MRIGLVCPYNYFRHGGVQVCVRETAAELEKRGHYVRVIAPKPRIVPKNYDSNIILVGGSTEFNTPFATKADLGLSASNEKLDHLLEQENFDILHFHEPGAPVLPVQILSRSKTHNVATMHATLPEGMVSKSFEKITIPLAKYIEPRLHEIVAVSEVAKATALSYAPHAQVSIIPNGIKLSEFLPKSGFIKPKKSKKTIVYIGRLEKRKGVRYLIDAYALLRQSAQDVELVIAGDGDLRHSLEAKVKKNNIPDVTFLGFIEDSKKVELLQTADVYCSPAIYGESFGIVLLEAMTANCVIVAGNNPGYTSVLTERGRLSLVDPKATEDFAQRLELLLYDQDVRTLWLNWAKEYVKQFDYSQIVNQYEEVYKRALQKPLIGKTT